MRTPDFPMALGRPVPLSRAALLSACAMACGAEPIVAAREFLHDQVEKIAEENLRNLCRRVLADPSPRLPERLRPEGARKKALGRLCEEGLLSGPEAAERLAALLDDSSSGGSSFFAAAGSGPFRHHSYPGGLSIHTATNIRLSLFHAGEAGGSPDGPIRRDILVAAQVLHDVAKPWTCRWEETGFPRAEDRLAGEAEHHALGLAESLLRGAPPEVILAQACAHGPPGYSDARATAVASLRAACILAGRDPAGLLAGNGPSGSELLHGTLVHFGDTADLLETPAAAQLREALGCIARERYGLSGADLKGAPFASLWNIACSRETILGLWLVFVKEGAQGLARRVERWVEPG